MVLALASCRGKPSFLVLSTHCIFRSLKSIIPSLKSNHNSCFFFGGCLYCPPDSFVTVFLQDFLMLSGFLFSFGSNFIICGDIIVHLDVDCDDICDDVLLSPCDSDLSRML